MKPFILKNPHQINKILTMPITIGWLSFTIPKLIILTILH